MRKYLIPAALAVLAFGLFQSGAQATGGDYTPKATATPKVTATPTVPRLSCEELLQRYNAEAFHVNGPPCVQVGVCGHIGGEPYSDRPCPPRPTPTAVVTPTPSPSPTATPSPTPPPPSGGGGDQTSSEEEPQPTVRLVPPVVAPAPRVETPCEAIIGLFNRVGKNAAAALVLCNGGGLPPRNDLPPNLRLPNAGN